MFVETGYLVKVGRTTEISFDSGLIISVTGKFFNYRRGIFYFQVSQASVFQDS